MSADSAVIISDRTPSCVDEEFYFAAAYTAGDTAMVDLSTTATLNGTTVLTGAAAKQSTATADLSTVLGGIVKSGLAGSFGLVRRSGVQTGVACKSTVTASDTLRSSTDAAGRLETMTSTDIATTGYMNTVGVALTTASSNTCTVLWRTK